MKIKWLRKLRKICSTPCECLGNSFAQDTPVHTEEGLRPIRDIAVGDRVLAFAEWLPEAQALSYQPVTDVISSTRQQELIRVTLDSGAVITATATHPIRTTEGWRNAKLLKTGGQLDLKAPALAAGDRTSARATATIVKLETLVREQTVYNLEVANAHTYFVGDDGILVHNGRFARGKRLRDEVNRKNRDSHGGNWQCDMCLVDLIPASQSQRGVTPPTNEVAYDHIKEHSKGGGTTVNNIRCLCRHCNSVVRNRK
jgi:hypothetical protein